MPFFYGCFLYSTFLIISIFRLNLFLAYSYTCVLYAYEVGNSLKNLDIDIEDEDTFNVYVLIA